MLHAAAYVAHCVVGETHYASAPCAGSRVREILKFMTHGNSSYCV